MKYIKRTINLILVFVLILNISLTAQEKPNPEDVQAKIESLRQVKAEMINLISTLKRDLKDLRGISDSLSSQYQTDIRELYIMRYGKDAGAKVASGMVWTGMTENMLRDSWGKPDSISSNKQPWGTYNQWYYGDITYFFKNGKMIDFEEGPAKD